MFLILKAIFTIGAFFFLLTVISGLSLAMRLRNHLRNPFMQPENNAPPAPPAGKGDIIEGEFTVIDEKSK